jgi:hypothetical protein
MFCIVCVNFSIDADSDDARMLLNYVIVDGVKFPVHLEGCDEVRPLVVLCFFRFDRFCIFGSRGFLG